MNMIGNYSKFVVTLMIITAAQTAPRRNRGSSVPAWHKPCGDNIDGDNFFSPIENYQMEVTEALKSISLQHQLMLNNYLGSDYEFLYEGVRLGVQKHQYIPTWIPGKKDVSLVKKLENAKSVTIANHLPKLHTDLQKFAVAFEELVQDESVEKLHDVLKSTQGFIMMTLCEVESVLAALPPLRVPRRINRSIMSRSDRNPVDDTRRLVRDWGVLMKYKDYLHAWRHVFDY